MNHTARCKYCGHRWQLAPSDPLPGKSLACPKCKLDGATIVLDFGDGDLYVLHAQENKS